MLKLTISKYRTNMAATFNSYPVSPTSRTDSPKWSARPTSTASLLIPCVHTTWRNSSGTPARLSMKGPASQSIGATWCRVHQTNDSSLFLLVSFWIVYCQSTGFTSLFAPKRNLLFHKNKNLTVYYVFFCFFLATKTVTRFCWTTSTKTKSPNGRVENLISWLLPSLLIKPVKCSVTKDCNMQGYICPVCILIVVIYNIMKLYYIIYTVYCIILL